MYVKYAPSRQKLQKELRFLYKLVYARPWTPAFKPKSLEMLDKLRQIMRECGEEFPKKHGKWFRLHVYNNHYLVYDSWNGQIYHYPNGANPSDTDNLYGVVYVFYDDKGKNSNREPVEQNMANFWYAHVCHKPKRAPNKATPTP